MPCDPNALIDRIPGVLGDLARHVRAHDWRRDEPRALALALAAVSSISAGYVLEFGGHPTFADIYIVLICPSATGKTSLGQYLIELVQRALGPDECALKMPDSLGSAPGVWDDLADNAISGNMVAATLICDEFGSELLAMTGRHAGHRALLLPLLRRLSGAGGRVVPPPMFSRASKTAWRRQSLRYPVVGLLGLTTEAPLAQALTTDAFENGTVGRFLVLRSAYRGRAAVSTAELPENLLDNLRMIWERTKAVASATTPGQRPPRIRVPLTEGAENLAERILDKQETEVEGLAANRDPLASVIARRLQHVLKLALHWAVSKDPKHPTVCEDAIEWARGVVALSEQAIGDVLNAAPLDRAVAKRRDNCDRVVNYVLRQSAAGSVSFRDVQRGMGLLQSELRPLVERLIEEQRLSAYNANGKPIVRIPWGQPVYLRPYDPISAPDTATEPES